MVKTHLRTFEEVLEHLTLLQKEFENTEEKMRIPGWVQYNQPGYMYTNHAQLVLVRDLLNMMKQ